MLASARPLAGRQCTRLSPHHPPGLRYDESSIGRVLTTVAGRGQGFGRALMEEGITRLRTLYPYTPIRISAQQYLVAFYTSLGFQSVSEPYDEDGIPHVEMFCTASV